MKWVFEVIAPPFVHSTNAGFEEDYASAVARVSDMTGNVKCVVSKGIFVDLIAHFCWQSQQRRCFEIVCVSVSRISSNTNDVTVLHIMAGHIRLLGFPRANLGFCECGSSLRKRHVASIKIVVDVLRHVAIPQWS